MADEEQQQPVVTPVGKPLSLIPVTLKEAALDSPTFRATAFHFAEQIDTVERWLEGYVRAATKLAQEVSTMEGVVNTFLASSSPPSQLSEAVVDHDYTMLALQRYSEGARDFWNHTIGGVKKTQSTVIDPINTFLQNETRPFKDTKRNLESTQKFFDSLLSRYYSQSKAKEPSALREDAFQLHEARKAYLKASMDFCVLAPQLHAALDALLIRVFSDQWLELKTLRETFTASFKKHGEDMERVRGWSREMGQGDRTLRRELLLTRKQIEDSAESAMRPSRQLDDYAASTVPFLSSRPPASTTQSSDTPSTKQGWLFLRTVTGKPSRTTWIRRWFFVNNGMFGWLVQGAKSGGVEESEKIGVLLCSVRAAFQEDRRFCFEVKTKDTTILLQAETQTDLTRWISVFEVAKQKALEEPTPSEALTSSGLPASDAAFAVSPAVAPELAAKNMDGHIANITEDLSATHHSSELEAPAVATARHSIDVTTAKKAAERAEADKNRDHGSRLIQKLDLHRKTTAGAQLSGGAPALSPAVSSAGGVASLISASHNTLPLGFSGSDTLPVMDRRIQALDTSSSNSLVPSTLANPPAPTNLSKTAVMLGVERGLDLGVVDVSGGFPSSLMANQWGTTNYGHLSRLERGEVKPLADRAVSPSTTPVARRLSDPPLPRDVTASTSPGDVEPPTIQPPSPVRTISQPDVVHRKTNSDAEGAALMKRTLSSSAEFPSFYPSSMKPHDAQFRMLFPNVPLEERVVLVFRASWNPDARQDLPGRVFVTLKDLYFYSHHYGFILVSGVSLANVLDVSASRSGSHDLLYLRVQGRNEREEPTTITIKTFLEPIKLLRRRLDFLISNCSVEEPATLGEALHTLIKMEINPDQEGGLSDSWDDVSPTRTGGSPQRTRHQTRASLRVDRNLHNFDQTALTESQEPVKFRLPPQPVVYHPKHMDSIAAQGTFEVSAKALFHIMFGDKSVISQMLYRQRRSEAVKQHPWISEDGGHWSRKFEYDIYALDSLRRPRKVTIIDSQIVDVSNDHLCYVVTDTKTPWHLPRATDFSMVTKIVITHVAKSTCSLKIFTKVEWSEQPAFYKRLIERHAADDLHLDALELFDLVADQVQRLGPNSNTKRVIAIFGHIGQQTEIAQITSADVSTATRSSRVIVRQRSLIWILFETLASFGISALSTVVMFAVGIAKALLHLFTIHWLLLILLLSSFSMHMISSTEKASLWWRDRTAASFMARLGVVPKMELSKSIYLRDLNDLVVPSANFTNGSDNKCSSTFQTLLHHSDLDSHFTTASTHSTALRLQNTRHRMSTYRHDLLVAIRLVNSIERETVRAEYGNWLLEETIRCRRIGAILEDAQMAAASADNTTRSTPDGSGKDSTRQQQQRRLERLSRQLGDANVEHVRRWHKDYCESCFQEREALRLGETMAF